MSKPCVRLYGAEAKTMVWGRLSLKIRKPKGTELTIVLEFWGPQLRQGSWILMPIPYNLILKGNFVASRDQKPVFIFE